MSQSTEITPTEARFLWKALLGNATELITDAQLLLDFGRYARGHALIVIAKEEIGKAVRINAECSHAWSQGSVNAVRLPADIDDAIVNVAAYIEAAQGVGPFWGESNAFEPTPGLSREAEHALRVEQARDSAAEKRVCLYVFLDTNRSVATPGSVGEDERTEELVNIARVVEMLLIMDHTRMKHNSSEPYDTTVDRQVELLRLTNPGSERLSRIDDIHDFPTE